MFIEYLPVSQELFQVLGAVARELSFNWRNQSWEACGRNSMLNWGICKC